MRRGTGGGGRPPAVAAVLGVGYLLLPRMGSDLSAQVARADFFAAHGCALVDLRWYARRRAVRLQPGVAAGDGAARRPGDRRAARWSASAAAFAALLVRTGAPRPLLGSLVGVVTHRRQPGLRPGHVRPGVAFGLAALLALTLPAHGPPGRRRLRSGWPSRRRCWPRRPARWPGSSSVWPGSRCC